jgi:hypothetical protein
MQSQLVTRFVIKIYNLNYHELRKKILQQIPKLYPL